MLIKTASQDICTMIKNYISHGTMLALHADEWAVDLYILGRLDLGFTPLSHPARQWLSGVYSHIDKPMNVSPEHYDRSLLKLGAPLAA